MGFGLGSWLGFDFLRLLSVAGFGASNFLILLGIAGSGVVVAGV